ncbi:MAG TPA: type II secretion system protein GspM [Rhodopila sp.]
MTADAWLTGRRGQALAVTLGIAGLAVIWFGIVGPAWSWFDDRQDLLEQRQGLLLHMRDLAASLPALRGASADKPDAAAAAATAMLPGESDAIAAADLQVRVQQMAADAGASLTAVETLPPTPAAGHWHKVPLRVSLTAPWPVLMQLVRSVELSPTRILIDDVHFRSPVVAGGPPAAPIQASMVLYGFRPADSGAAGESNRSNTN